ncbi:MAG TPA: flavin reductase family protein [Brumimicrobium sp.]|nr:flavin reductase family protein [Brumimicrobium sp.]
MLTIDPKETPIPILHGYLTSAVGPRPIAFASTIDKDGVPNLAPFSFFNVFGANPPILVFSPARSGKTTLAKDSHLNVLEVPEVVINVVTYDILEQTILTSAAFDKGVDEFTKSGLTPIASDLVKPFRVKESPVQMECKVLQVIETGQGGAAGNLVICEVVRMHIDESVLDENQLIDPLKIDLVGRLGRDWHCRPHTNTHNSMFQMKQVLRDVVIGYDQIPQDIKESSVLSAKDIYKLGMIKELPNETDVNEYKLIELSELFISLEDEASELEQELHKIAKKHIENNELELAWKTLLTFNNQ